MISVVKLLPITHEIEARFSVRLYESPLIVVRAQQHVAVLTGHRWLLWYPDELFNLVSTYLFTSPDVVKLVCTPLSKLKQHYGLTECVQCQHINDYVCGKGGTKLLPEMKAMIVRAHTQDNAAQRIASIMMLFQEEVDSRQSKVLTPRTTIRKTFDRKRDAYLQYLTIFNDILSTSEVPLTAVQLAQAAEHYPNLCRIAMTPLEALDGCVVAGALQLHPGTATVQLIPPP